jgi:hypothetical protein
MTKLQKLYGWSLVIVIALLFWWTTNQEGPTTYLLILAYFIGLVFHLENHQKISIIISLLTTIFILFMLILSIYFLNIYAGSEISLTQALTLSIAPILFSIISIKVWIQSSTTKNIIK